MNAVPSRARRQDPRYWLFGSAILSLTVLVFLIVMRRYGVLGSMAVFTRLSVGVGAWFVLSSVAWVLLLIRPVNRFLTASWRGPVFLLAGVVAVIALFYAVENWRGERAWQTYKQSREARGEQFELVHYIPPAVPDDRNFFTTPSWADMHFTQRYNESEGSYSPVWKDKDWGKHVNFGVSSPHYGYHRDPPPLTTWILGRKIDLAEWQAYYRGTNNLFASGSGGFTNYFPIAARPQTPAKGRPARAQQV